MEAESGNAQPQAKRTGATREHYNRQKSQAYAHFRVRGDDLAKLGSAQFTIYDFITNSFSFSQTKKELAVAVLESLKHGPKTFGALQSSLGAKKSTLFMLVLALQRSGLVCPAAKGSELALSPEFSKVLCSYADWWAKWLSR
ncbi:MAG: hypothetical protein V1708_01420 [Candidatus Micrarchaeota archaeon]